MSDSPEARKTILVIEDDEVARDWFVAILAVDGHRTALATNGAQGLDYLRAHAPPDLIVLDMLLPVLDGWHFLDEVRRSEAYRDIPVVVVTSTILTPEWARDHGCAGLLRKPVRGDELLAEVRQALTDTPP